MTANADSVTLRPRTPPSAVCARWLGLSSRTLQRRLEEEGIVFRTLVEGVRRRLAVSLLRTSGVSIREIATLLGYPDVRGFHRAFVGWTGQTPAQVRGAS
jgi:AraC-like DNA-binding protein